MQLQVLSAHWHPCSYQPWRVAFMFFTTTNPPVKSSNAGENPLHYSSSSSSHNGRARDEVVLGREIFGRGFYRLSSWVDRVEKTPHITNLDAVVPESGKAAQIFLGKSPSPEYQHVCSCVCCCSDITFSLSLRGSFFPIVLRRFRYESLVIGPTQRQRDWEFTFCWSQINVA